MATRAKLQTDAYETWRPALAAFYRREAMPQSAECVGRGDPLSASDRNLIEALRDAAEAQAKAA